MSKKVKSFKSDLVPVNRMVMRMVEVRSETANAEDRSVEVVVASENPVERWDDSRGQVIREILDMNGCEFRTERRQLPIVDSHDRSTVRNVLGSVRNMRTENGQLIGRASFAADQSSQEAFQKLLDGHLTDFSITATPRESTFVQRGDVVRMNGKEISGPAEVITKWIPTDASLVAAGADETSTVRQLLRSYQDISNLQEIKRMSQEVLAALVAKGMPEQITDTEQALAWAVGVIGSVKPEMPETSMAEVENAAEPKAEEKPAEEPAKEEIAMSVDRALKADRALRKKTNNEIVAICEKAGIERAFADKLCDADVSLEVARERILERMTTKPVGSAQIDFVSSGEDRFNDALRTGLLQRAFQGASIKAKIEKADGADEFRHMSLMRMAEKWLQRQGVNTDRMNAQDIARAAMGSRGVLNRFNIQRSEAYHGTGAFSNLMLDAAKKTLQNAYEEAPYTWAMWCRQGPSTSDLKNINRIRFSESPDLEAIPEGGEYKEKTMSDQKETYAPIKYGALFSVTWEAIVNDDLSALSRIPAMHGNAARRKQNKAVYSVLTANATMSDSVALFGSHASGTNLDASGAAPSVSELNAAFAAMMTQKGLGSDAIINVQPRYLIVPAALAGTALELVNSTSYIVANGNAGVANIYGVNGQRPMQVIVEPQLDSNSATAWYLAADPSQIDTVELTFLAGEEQPVLESEMDFDTDSYKYKVRQTFGVKAIDWRGLYKNPGA